MIPPLRKMKQTTHDIYTTGPIPLDLRNTAQQRRLRHGRRRRSNLMELLGMSLFPFKYDAGMVERSMRRVKAVFKPGEVDKEQNRRWMRSW